MSMQTIEFIRDTRFVRRARALKTIETMLQMYCRAHRHGAGASLCAECRTLFDYATLRLQRCVFGDAKPTCANCLVHCYRADMRERIRTVMRWAGPRMMLRHPVMGIRHLLEERRPAPMLPARSTIRRKAAEGAARSSPTKELPAQREDVLDRVALAERARIQEQAGDQREQRDAAENRGGKLPGLS